MVDLAVLIARYLARFRFFPVFLRRARDNWVDAVMSGSISGILIFVLSALFSLSHYWLLLVFLVMFVIAAYSAWRDEYTKAITDNMIGRITGMSFQRWDNLIRVIIQVQIRNLGPQTSVHDWNARHINANDANTYLTAQIFEVDEVKGERGKNLLQDEDLVPQGGMRTGYLTFRMSEEDYRRVTEGDLDRNIELSFADTFGKRYRVTMFGD